jgi:hypothetical protein
MPADIRLWQVASDQTLDEIGRTKLDLEQRLQQWLADDISVLDRGLMVIGREVETDFGGFIDLLCIEASGDLVIVELKRDRTPREITAQALDYASWVVDLSNDRVSAIAEEYLTDAGFEESFRRRFHTELPDTLNSEHRILVVGSVIDPSSERIMRYLSDTHGVSINAATFQYFRSPDGAELLARVFLMEPSQVELQKRTRGSSKRRPDLTYDELASLAREAGVEDLYQYAVSAFSGHLRKSTTRSSIRFTGQFDGSRNVVFSLIPGESSEEDGLNYQLYKYRFGTLTGLSDEEVGAIMPADNRHWIYHEGADPDYEGYAGFIRSHDEIARLAAALDRAADDGR